MNTYNLLKPKANEVYLFQTGADGIMPVAFLIHSRKKEKTHARFFEFVASSFPKINKTSVPFVTDREIGLVNAIRKNFPSCDVLMCWNHLIKDLKFNLQQMGADQSNTALYVSHLKDLLRSDSEAEYMTLKDELIRKWSKPVVVYFEKMEKDILTHSGKWVIDKYQNLYDPYSGITNNACESMNAVIKGLNKYRELPVDCFVLSMFYLQNYYINEVQRGLAGIGNYTLRTKFNHASIPKDEINVPKQLVKPADIVKHVMSEIDNVRDTCSKDHVSVETESSKIEGANILPLVSETSDGTENPTMSSPIAEENVTAPSQIEGTNILPLVSDSSEGTESSSMSIKTSDKNLSQKSLAKLTVDNGQVSFIEQHKAFMVRGMQGKVYAVTLLPKETCQCQSIYYY
ncbi:unnamed protein product [Mytilus edulis]|uniref:MULE transposase domain-containing protein n=1 Tax=Mytilus edulis TaxID=6550 RepID=A0A8S3QF88_MYTED|nr:unnamed protein product [Mytilus edulis]